MINKQWRLDMKLKSAQMLHEFMNYKDFNIRTLAKAAGVSPATIGHMHSGARDTCKAATAKAIEKALGAPPGLLFEARASNVSREVAA